MLYTPIGSRPVVGSSKKIYSGSAASARAMEILPEHRAVPETPHGTCSQLLKGASPVVISHHLAECYPCDQHQQRNG